GQPAKWCSPSEEPVGGEEEGGRHVSQSRRLRCACVKVSPSAAAGGATLLVPAAAAV
ncbi:hypothetical protein MNEG_10938, partial [Monoraphidium neglectum]